MRASLTVRVLTGTALAALFALSTALTGCGNTLYAVRVNAAARKLEQARELGAEKYSPYEFYASSEHLEKAKTEASEADYDDAIALAGRSEKFAEKAIEKTKKERSKLP